MKNTVKNEKTREIGKHSVSTFVSILVSTTNIWISIFFIPPLTIEMVKDYRPMADCEKTSRLIGFADVLPMIGSPLDYSILLNFPHSLTWGTRLLEFKCMAIDTGPNDIYMIEYIIQILVVSLFHDVGRTYITNNVPQYE